MRYFRRSGPTVVISESETRGPRLARGPHDGEPGDIISYDDYYPDEAAWAEQLAVSPGWYEVDSAGSPLAVGTTPVAAARSTRPAQADLQTAEPVESADDVSEETPVSTTEG